ncbi:MAG: hypothetical protein IKZ49_02675 [Alphaproteobacteria bacterium]|nr:hypothetical protein [Alphaproteobacteria bacterium]
MQKIKEFFKTNIELVKWTIEYFFILWLILQYIFNFDAFSANHWWKFFHASFHGFAGFVFATLMYTAIPIYIATSINVYKNKASLIKIPFIDKIFEFIKTKFSKPAPVADEEEKKETEETESEENIFPSDMPPELKVPYMRAKHHQSLMGAVSVYNKTDNDTKPKPTNNEPTPEDFPIPTDFDLPFDNDDQNSANDFSLNMNEDLSIPQFKDINFDDELTSKEENKLENFTTKYFDAKHINYEIIDEFVCSDKNLIYEHSDEDFWIMDDDTWFAAGKQKESPIQKLLTLSKDTPFIPTIYLRSQNIMDIDETIKKFESMGIRVVKNLEELE